MPPKKPRSDLAPLLQLPKPRIAVDATRTRADLPAEAARRREIAGRNAPTAAMSATPARGGSNRGSTPAQRIGDAVGRAAAPGDLSTIGGWLQEFVNPVRGAAVMAEMGADVSNALGHGRYGQAAGLSAMAGAGLVGVPGAKLPKLGKAWAVITPENPGGMALDAAGNAARRAEWAQKLKDRGIRFREVTGSYLDNTTGQRLSEQGFLFPDLSPSQAEALGREMGQNGVLTHRGYHDLAAGKLFPSSGVEVPSSQNAAYTQVGRDRFSSQIDWDHSVPLGEPDLVAAPSAPRFPSVSAKNRTTTPKMDTFVDPPEVVANRIAEARALLSRPVNVPPPPKRMGVVDASRIVPDAGPNIEPLPERQGFTNRAAMGHMVPSFSPENIDLIIRQVRRGQAIGAGDTFYPAAQATNEAMLGAGASPDLARLMSAGAIRSPVDQEIVTGSTINWALETGVITREQLARARAMGGTSGQKEFARLAQKVRDAYNTTRTARNYNAGDLQMFGGHLDAAETMLAGGYGDAYKIPTYHRQKTEGAVPGFVLDTHESKGSTLANPYHRFQADASGYANEHYGLMENLYRGIAQDLGLSDRAFQANRWTGGGILTGLRTPANMDYAHIFEDLLKKNAEAQLGNSGARGIDKMLKEMAAGRLPLFKIN